jgi:hypothetical protein
VVVPTAVWLVWYLTTGLGTADVPDAFRYDGWDLVSATWRGVRASFDGLAVGNRWAGLLLTLAFAALLAWRLRCGHRSAANQVAWTVGLFAWWGGVVYSRGVLADPSIFRYRWVGAIFILLAALPVEPVAVAEQVRARVPTIAQGGVVVAVAVVLALANRSEVDRWADQQREFGRASRQLALVVAVDPPIAVRAQPGTLVGPDVYRRAVEVLGSPIEVRRSTLDRELVRTGIGLVPVTGRARPCTQVRGTVRLGRRAVIDLVGGRGPVEVSVRRFGKRFVPVGELRAGERGRLTLPAISAREPWELRAKGACRVRPGR